MLFETIQLSPTAMGYINWNDGNAIASVCLDGACSLGRLSLDTLNHVNKALKPLGKSLSITPCVSTTWDYRKPVAFEIHGTAYRINLYVSLWVM